MNSKGLYVLAAGIGSTAGSLVPGLWGGSDFSGWSIILGMVGGFLGLWIAYKLNN